MENKKNFYSEYNEMYKNMEKFELDLKIITTNKQNLPFPYLPFSDDIEDKLTQSKLLGISNNNELFFIASPSFDETEEQPYNKVGAVCKVECVNAKDNGINYICNVLYFAVIDHIHVTDNKRLAHVVPIEIANKNTETTAILLTKAKASFFDLFNYANKKLSVDLGNYIKNNNDADIVSNLIAASCSLSIKDQYKLMCEVDMESKLEFLIVLLSRMFNFEVINKRVDERIRQENEKRHKEMYIKEKIKHLSEEITEDNEFDQIEQKILNCKMPKQSEEYALVQLKKLMKTPSVSADHNVLKNYLEVVTELPWSVSTEDNTDIKNAKQVLDKDHFGLDKVKSRILEYLAVLKLNKKVSGQILCLVGAPGVGKTSIAKSVADALGRKFAKLTLGGLHDESEIRGHRKTYVGAMVGKIMHNIKLCGSNNPVFLLDEIDKMSFSNHGDPASALLEVLDPNQNQTFRDNFVEVPFDLSNIVFIATANYIENIPAPLKDRMEIINVDSYTAPEKVNIFKKYLLGKCLKACGVEENAIEVEDKTIFELIDKYTYEAGVRSLERLTNKICRKLAVKLVEDVNFKMPWKISADMLPEILDEPPVTKQGVKPTSQVGVSYGLAFSTYGGSLLTMEAVKQNGKGNVIITGNLKDVMKESCQIAHTVAKQHITKSDLDFSKIDVHVNVCEGGIPKDGPSAGVVMSLVIYSVLTNQKISNKFAMTGEISLTGDVYPIGGLREKLYACVESGIKHVIVPMANKKDVEFVPAEITKELNINYVSKFSEVIKLAIEVNNEN